MGVALNPYLSFRGTAREAMEFYRSVFGGELTTSTYGDFGASDDPSEQHKIMHGQLDAGDGLVFMGADVPASAPFTGQAGVSMSLSGDDAERLRGYWDALSAGGTVVEPLAVAPWGDSFGMCVDRYGTNWMVNIAGTPAQ